MSRLPVAVGVIVSCSTLLAVELPRYSLPVGRTLTYTSESKDEMGAQGSRSSQSETSVIVVGANSDGSKRLIVRTSSKVDLGGGRTMDETQTSRMDLFVDGRIVPTADGRPGSDRSGMFPLLPADQPQIESQWQFTSPIDGAVCTHKMKSDAPGRFVFTTSEDGPINRIYLVKTQSMVQFDRPEGVVVESETQISQDYGIHSRQRASMKLVKDEMMEPAKAEALGKDYDIFLAAQKQAGDLGRRMEEQPALAKEFAPQARAVLEEASKTVSNEDVKAEFARVLKSYGDNLNYQLEDAQKKLEILDKPAKAWHARDIDGKDWSMADLRGKVVVMDFWYRGCGWCMYAMPQVKQLTIDFKDKPVVFLGMNTDRNDDDAKFVVKEFGLPYAQIKAETIAKDMNVHAFPTMIIADRQGIVRAFEVGWSPNLREKVTAKLEKLLNSAQ